MSDRLSYFEVRKAILDIIDTKPDWFFYVPGPSGCENFNSDIEPACVVGHLFAVWKDDDEWRRRHRWGGVESFWDIDGKAHDNVGVPSVTPKAFQFLSAIQQEQDNGIPWTTAFDRAVASVSNMFENEKEEETDES